MRDKGLTGFVIGRRNLRDSDLIITAFTKELGKISFVAKGIKKPNAKLRSHTEPLNEVKFRVTTSSKLPILVGAQATRANRFFNTSSDKQLGALFITEVLGLVTTEEQPSQAIYGLYSNFIEDFPKTHKDLLMINYFLISLLRACGLEPQLEVSGPNVKYYFDYDEGLVSLQRPKHRGGMLSPDVVKLWRSMLTYTEPIIMRISTKQTVLIKSLETLSEYIEYHFSKKIKSLPVLRESTNLLQAG